MQATETLPDNRKTVVIRGKVSVANGFRQYVRAKGKVFHVPYKPATLARRLRPQTVTVDKTIAKIHLARISILPCRTLSSVVRSLRTHLRVRWDIGTVKVKSPDTIKSRECPFLVHSLPDTEDAFLLVFQVFQSYRPGKEMMRRLSLRKLERKVRMLIAPRYSVSLELHAEIVAERFRRIIIVRFCSPLPAIHGRYVGRSVKGFHDA